MKTYALLGLALVSAAMLASYAHVQDSAPATKPAPSNPAVVPVPRNDQGILARQDEVLKRAKEAAPANVVFIGDSITQGWEGAGREVWEREFAPLGALNLGVSGDRTEHVLWRLQQAPLARLQPKCVVLLIGTNNLGHGTSTGVQTLEGVRAVVALVREQAPAAKLLVHEIFPRGETFNAMRGEIAQINQALRAEAARGKGAEFRTLATGDQWVGVDGAIPRDIMPDFLHLSPQGYAQWAADIKPALSAALK